MSFARLVAQARRAIGPATGVLLALVAGTAVAQYPEIGALDRSDPLYAQHQRDIREYYRRSSAGEELPPLLLYRYSVRTDDTLFGLAARLSLPYSALATLNRLDAPELEPGSTLLIPGVPGVFVPLAPESDLESIMHDLRRERQAGVVTVPGQHETSVFRFFPGEDFLPEERLAFLGMMFRHPLPDGELTSRWGHRVNPITAEYGFHGGADYAATEGTRVLASRGGRVSELGDDPVLGRYVILEHTGGFQTVYGHLSTIAVSLNDEVRSGMILGAVGSTGMVTGPHLHFEIRQHGRSRDPEAMLPRENR
ncbi:MAG: LysM peptidoglycan-binding domain-containing M23 family metallopeptidase [Spirochaetota bacterium]